MFKILKLNKISPVANKYFDAKYEFSESVENPEGIMLRSFKMHDYPLNDNLLAVARAGAGVNNIPIDKCTEKGIVVFNTPGANANAVKELAICSLLLASRKISDGINWANTLKGKGDEVGKLVEKGKSQFGGFELIGKTLAVVGLGAIGAMVANAGVDLGMNVMGYDPYLSVDAAWSIKREVKKVDDINEIFKNADYISLHVPLVESTKNLVNAESIAKMKSGVKIVNLSRDALVDSADIVKAVNDGKVGCYVTDFATDELLAVPNIICMPHLGASTEEAEDNCAIAASKEIVAYLENGNIKNSVNFPACEMPESGSHRVTVMHMNNKGIIQQIISVLDVNIENMVNKSKGELAYSIFDFNNLTATADAIVEKLQAIEGVIKARVIK